MKKTNKKVAIWATFRHTEERRVYFNEEDGKRYIKKQGEWHCIEGTDSVKMMFED